MGNNKTKPRERIGAMIEDYICNHLSHDELRLKYKLTSKDVSSSLSKYFGKPNESVFLTFKKS